MDPQQTPDPHELCPPPHAAVLLPSRLTLGSALGIRSDSESAGLASRFLRDWLRAHGQVEGAATLVTYEASGDPSLGAEGYLLQVDAAGVRIRAEAPRGFLYGTYTLLDWLELHPEASPIQGLRVQDRPDLPLRGVLLDVSRDKVPALETLRSLIDRLARLRVNQLQLYMEHTFAYSGHEEVWRDASPFTPEEVRELRASCLERGIELVPCQNSLGHFHRWLIHPRYRALAECPEGRVSPFTPAGEPFSLCAVDPASLALIEELYDQLLPNFDSVWLNVGLDETWDMGLGRSADAVRDRGLPRVYLDYLLAVHDLAARRGKRIQYWGDIVLQHPELIPELPQDTLALQWGYEADHPFGPDGERFAAAGVAYACCPGTSSWNSIGGRVRNALANLRGAAFQARRLGGRGLLITDWGDYGHWQPLPVSYIPLVAGAAAAWNEAAAALRSDAEVLDWTRRVFLPGCPRELVECLYDLGDTERFTGVRNRNGALAFRALQHAGRPWPPPDCEGIEPKRLEAARERMEDVTRRAAARSGLVAREIAWAASLITTGLEGARHLAALGAGADWPTLPHKIRRRLATTLLHLESEHRELWHARNRPGGFQDSVGRLTRVRRLCGD